MSTIRPNTTITVFLDPYVFDGDDLAPLSVEVKELDLKSHGDRDSNVVVLHLDQVSFHMTKRQLDFIATALATASALEPGSINVSRKLDQPKPGQDAMERAAERLLAGTSFTVGEDA